MQTFLPYPEFTLSANCLDYRRLGKQRSEAYGNVYLCYRIKGTDKRHEMNMSDQYAEYLWSRYRNHPAILMWVNNIETLKLYYNVIIAEWVLRVYKNNMPYLAIEEIAIKPKWLGDENFHASHRSNLLRKDPEYYKQFNWTEPNDLPYIWPVRKGENYVGM